MKKMYCIISTIIVILISISGTISAQSHPPYRELFENEKRTEYIPKDFLCGYEIGFPSHWEIIPILQQIGVGFVVRHPDSIAAFTIQHDIGMMSLLTEVYNHLGTTYSPIVCGDVAEIKSSKLKYYVAYSKCVAGDFNDPVFIQILEIKSKTNTQKECGNVLILYEATTDLYSDYLYFLNSLFGEDIEEEDIPVLENPYIPGRG